MKYIFTLLTLVSIFVSGAASAQSLSTLEQIKSTGTIYIGYRQDAPPMSFVDKDNQPAGYSIDLCSHIVTEIKAELKDPNIAVKYVPVTAASRFNALIDNSIDILCGSTTKTLSRAKKVDFTQLSFVTGASLLSLASAKINGIPDLEGEKIAVVKGSTMIDSLKDVITQLGVNVEIFPVDNAADGINAVADGKAAAFSSDQIVLIGLVLTHKNPELFSIAEGIYSYEPFALAVRQNDSEFRLIANRVLSRLNRSGNITPIYAKWFGGYTKQVPTLLEAMYIINSTPE